MNKDRLAAFTDAILAIIMTILVLELEKPSEASWAAVWALLIDLFAAITYTTPPSVSLEGKRIWLNKSLPIATKDILFSKRLIQGGDSAVPFGNGGRKAADPGPAVPGRGNIQHAEYNGKYSKQGNHDTRQSFSHRNTSFRQRPENAR